MRGSLARRALSAARSGVLLTMRCKRSLIMICTIGRAHYARPAPASEDMKELIQLFAQIALLRRGEDALWQVPVACAGLLLIIWLVAASSQIVKAALEWSSPASVVLVILQIFTGRLLVLALFPPVKA